MYDQAELHSTYDKIARDRDVTGISAWKVEERKRFLNELNLEGIRTLLEPKRFFAYYTDEALLVRVTRIFDLVSYRQVQAGRGEDFHFQSLVLRKPRMGPFSRFSIKLLSWRF